MARSKMKIKKVCEWCSTTFCPPKLTTRFCSHRCNNLAYKEAVRQKRSQEVEDTTIGLCAENTNIKGNQITSNEKFNRNYWNFFPEVSILLDLADGDHSIALDLSRWIIRPFYNDLNPFKIWTSDNTYTMGNIHIKPMIYNDVDLNYTLFGDYMFDACYSHGTDAFSEYTYLAEDSKQRGIRATLSYNYHTSTRGVWQMGHHKHLLNVSLSKEFKFGGALNIDAMNLLNYKPSNYYNGDNYSYNNNPKTDNMTIQLRYTQRFGQSRVRRAKDRSKTNHLGRFKK